MHLMLAASPTTSTNATTDFFGIVGLGALALIVFTVVYVKEKQISAVYGRVFALIVVAVLGVALGLANVSGTNQTAGFTLLGTVAGYLAGSKTQTTTTAGRAKQSSAEAASKGGAHGLVAPVLEGDDAHPLDEPPTTETYF